MTLSEEFIIRGNLISLLTVLKTKFEVVKSQYLLTQTTVNIAVNTILSYHSKHIFLKGQLCLKEG